MKKSMLILAFLMTVSGSLLAQDTLQKPGRFLIVDGDTLAIHDLSEVVIIPPVNYENRRQAARYDRLLRNIKIVYPYAKLAGEKLRYYESVLDTISGEKARKAYLKKAQKELEDQFGREIRDLTFSQGKILIKLIYRETGNTTYEIVKELRGNFTAFIWQSVARIFGYDLRTPYDPEGEDAVIEQMVRMLESGAL